MKNLILITILAFFAACGPSKKENQSNGEIMLDSLKSEVLSIHDEVMPKMGELRRARKDLLLQADSLMKSDSTRANTLTRAANDLADANESMMVWMRQFEFEFEGTDEEVRAYFEDQKKSITKVRDDMLSTLKNGKMLLDN